MAQLTWKQMMMMQNLEFRDDDIERQDWDLLVYALMYDYDKAFEILRRIKQEGKQLVAVYPGVPEMMEGIDESKMEYIGDIMDGALYLK